MYKMTVLVAELLLLSQNPMQLIFRMVWINSAGL